MIGAPYTLTRPAAKAAGPLGGTTSANSASSDVNAAESAGNAALAEQQQSFNLATSESAELNRELAALDDLLMAQAKDEDEIMKKWIAMI